MTTRPDAHLQIRDLVVQRGGVTVLEIDSLDIPRGLVTVLIGPTVRENQRCWGRYSLCFIRCVAR